MKCKVESGNLNYEAQTAVAQNVIVTLQMGRESLTTYGAGV